MQYVSIIVNNCVKGEKNVNDIQMPITNYIICIFSIYTSEEKGILFARAFWGNSGTYASF